MEALNQFISNIIEGNNVAAKEMFNQLVAERAAEALAERKQEIATRLFQTEAKKNNAEREVDEEVELDEETLDEVSPGLLARAATAASDPDADYAYGVYKDHDPQKYADYAKKKFGAKIGAQVQGAANAKGHFPRPGHSTGWDKLGDRAMRSTNANMTTKSGKLTKSAQKGLKSSLKLK